MLFVYELAAVALLVAGAAVAYSLQWRLQGLDKKPGVRDVTVSSVILFLAMAAALGILYLGKVRIAKGSSGGGNATEDSPVNPHGGSFIIRGLWNKGSDDYHWSTTMPSGKALLYSLDGVYPVDGKDTNPQLVSLKIKQAWIIHFTFRRRKTTGDDDNTLKLCASDPECSSTDGKAGDTLYLVGDSKYGKFKIVTRDRPGIRYDIQNCTAPPDPDDPETHCNHIYDVYVITAKSGLPGTRYRCLDGECSVQIGKPKNVDP